MQCGRPQTVDMIIKSYYSSHILQKITVFEPVMNRSSPNMPFHRGRCIQSAPLTAKNKK